MLHYRRRKSVVQRLQRELAEVPSLAVQADLRREPDARKLVAAAVSAFGRIDTFIANAGIWEHREVPLHRMSLRQWRRTLDSDLTSVFLCCREFFRLLRRQRRGNVVLVGSTAGVFGEAGHADYAASKAALAYGLTRTLKNEIARLAPHTAEYCGGRVNCVCPGWVVTPMTARQLQDGAMVRRVISTMALPQIARPADIANAIVFLASDHLARHVTGQTVVLAGGMEGRRLWEEGELDPSTA